MIIKEKLADLSMGYCISLLNWNGTNYCITASEEREGEILLINTATGAVQKITGLAGGVMSILAIPEEDGAFLAIQKFYPIFDSVKAEVVYCKLNTLQGEILQADVTPVTALPYVHRIALTGEAGARKLIAAALCESKAFQDDWSQAGAVYEYTLNASMQVCSQRTLIDGIHKNHGMFLHGDDVLISGEEGVWKIAPNGETEQLCDEGISDLCMFDIDGDGVDELICIEPFHGDTLRVFRKTAGGWKSIASAPLNFGHAVWCGPCGKETVILSCSRGGERNTTLHKLRWNGAALALEDCVVDADVGASNIAVAVAPEGIALYAANHGKGETARYTITSE